MNFETWFKDEFRISETGNDKELLRIAYKAGMDEQKEKDIGIALGTISSSHSEQAMSGRIAKAIRNQNDA